MTPVNCPKDDQREVGYGNGCPVAHPALSIRLKASDATRIVAHSGDTKLLRDDEIEALARRAAALTDFVALEVFLGEVTERLGFTYFAMTSFVTDPLAVRLPEITNFPDAVWQFGLSLRRVESNSPNMDPLLALVRTRVAPFTWSEALQEFPPSPEYAAILRQYKDLGMGGEALIVPTTTAAGPSGGVRYVMAPDESMAHDVRPAAHYLSVAAYDAAIRISRTLESASPAPPGLTARQLECITLVARGKGDWEIGQLLQISKETVHKHVQAAMKRYDVTTRTQLVVRALYSSQISFDDVMR